MQPSKPSQEAAVERYDVLSAGFIAWFAQVSEFDQMETDNTSGFNGQ